MRMFTLALVVLCLTVAETVSGDNPVATDSGQWLQWRGSNHDNISVETGWLTSWPKDGPGKLWSRNVGIGLSAVSISNGRLYTIGWKSEYDTVFCLDVDSGDLVWSYSYRSPLWDREHEGGPGSTPTLSEGLLYTFSREGHLFCFETNSGNVVWLKNIREEFNVGPRRATPHRDYGYTGSPLIIGNLLILEIGSQDVVAAAFDKSTGNLLWQCRGRNFGAGYGTPIPLKFNNSAQSAVAVFNTSELIVLNAQTGQKLSQYEWKTPFGVNVATPLIDKNRIFISSAYGMGGALLEIDGDQPRVLWKNKALMCQFSSPVLYQGHIYGFDQSGLKCVELGTGILRWKQRGFGQGSLMVVDSKLLIMGERGQLALAATSPNGYRELAKTKVFKAKCWPVPLLLDGRIYGRNVHGDLVCLNVSMDSQRPM